MVAEQILCQLRSNVSVQREIWQQKLFSQSFTTPFAQGYQALRQQDGKQITWKEDMSNTCSNWDFVLSTCICYCCTGTQDSQGLIETFSMRI